MGPGAGYPGWEDPKQREIYRWWCLTNGHQLRLLGTSLLEEQGIDHIGSFEDPYADFDD